MYEEPKMKEVFDEFSKYKDVKEILEEILEVI